MTFDVLAAGLDSRFNPLADRGRDALAIENEKDQLDIVPRGIATRSAYR
jgi:hypothetical protein